MKRWIVILEFFDRAPDPELEIDSDWIRNLIADHIAPELPSAVGYTICSVTENKPLNWCEPCKTWTTTVHRHGGGLESVRS